MTRMAETDGPEHAYDEEPPRSIFSALWFRALIVILVLGVVAAVAVPYVLDFVNPPVVRKTASAPPSLPPPSPPSAQTAPAPATPPPPAAAAIPSKPVEATKPGADTAKMATAVEPRKPLVARTTPPAPPATKKPVVATSSGGPYWVQVGAYKNQATAKQLAAKLREQNYKVKSR